jgi:hypothetical protein
MTFDRLKLADASIGLAVGYSTLKSCEPIRP